MLKVILLGKVHQRIDEYSTHYRQYYEELYQDSGIWSEERIIEGYLQESLLRKEEIYNLLSDALSEERVFGRISENNTVLRWRSKYLFVTWEDDGNERIITDLDIR